MSQSSETTRQTRLLKLNYPEQTYSNTYYTARIEPDVGVTVSYMVGEVFIQFFPWTHPEALSHMNGHQRYAKFITSRAAEAQAKASNLFDKWPYLSVKETDDILTIKCLIEDGRNQINERRAQNDANDCTLDPYSSAGKAVE